MTRAIPTVVMRGGTSRGLVVDREQLSSDAATRDDEIRAMFGSPHSYQVDGLGGGRPPTSKLALVGTPTRPEADIDYTFAQVGVEDGSVDMSGTCGNLSAAVVLYAVETGLVAPVDGTATVTVHNTNTGELIVGLVPESGAIGAERSVFLDYADMAGGSSAILPTGRPLERLRVDDLGKDLDVTLANVGNAQVYVRASDLGLRGDEDPAVLDADPELTVILEAIRRAGRRVLAQAGVPGLAEPTRLPLVSVLSAPGDEGDVRLRLSAVGRIHQSIAGSAAVSLAATATLDGTLAREFASVGVGETTLRIAHPAGVMRVRVTVEPDGTIRRLAYERTARRIMEGICYV